MPSPPIEQTRVCLQRALAVWAALETSNWARFFRLVRSAAYVEGCFLHRHLRAVRGRALRTMAGSMKEAGLPGEAVQVGGQCAGAGEGQERGKVTRGRLHS